MPSRAQEAAEPDAGLLEEDARPPEPVAIEPAPAADAGFIEPEGAAPAGAVLDAGTEEGRPLESLVVGTREDRTAGSVHTIKASLLAALCV